MPDDIVEQIRERDCRDRARHPYLPEDIGTLDGYTPFVDPAAPPDELIQAEQNWALIAQVLASLDTRTRNAFILHRIHGAKYRDIARQLNVSPSTVEKDIALVMALLIEGAQRS